MSRAAVTSTTVFVNGQEVSKPAVNQIFANANSNFIELYTLLGDGTNLVPGQITGALKLTNQTTASTANAGGATIPATALGYITTTLNGVSVKIPYFAV